MNNNDMNNKYRYVMFDYIGSTMRGYSSTNKKAKHDFQITGRKGQSLYAFYMCLCFVVFVFSFLLFYSSNLGSNNSIFNFSKNFDESSIIYKILEPMGLIDVRFIVFIFVILLVIFKRRSIYKNLEPKGSSINIYSRELPSNLRPAHMRLLLNDGLIDEVSLGSTIVDLIDKGYLEYYKEENDFNKLNFFHNEDSKLIKTNKSHDGLLKYEKFTIDWFINGYGNGVEVTAKEVNNGLKTHKQIYDNMGAFDMFLEWQALVLMSFPIDKYYTKLNQSKNKLVYLILGIMGFISIMTYVGSLLVVYGFGMLLLASPARTLNKTGVDEICEWLSLKKFLVDFGDMENKTAEMVKIWDFYLTYSMALNVSNKASEEINKFFKDNIYLKKPITLKESYKAFERLNKTFIGNTNSGSFGDNQFPKNASTITGINNTITMISNYKAPYYDQLKLEIEEEYKKL